MIHFFLLSFKYIYFFPVLLLFIIIIHNYYSALFLQGETRVRRNAYATEVDCPVTLWPGGKICYTWDSSISDSADGKLMCVSNDPF